MTKRLDWITDPHMDHFRDQEMLLSFVKKLHARNSDGLFITGDIAGSKTIYDFLGLISGAYQRPVYFVLGNHDFHGGWMEDTHKTVRAVCAAVPEGVLNWLTECEPIMLDRKTAVIGHDGFYDGQKGQAGLTFNMPDFYAPGGIHDLCHAFGMGTRHLFDILRELGAHSVAHIHDRVIKAYKTGARRILILTHVPPFPEASYYKGRPSEPAAMPFFVNQALGEALLELAEEFPKAKFEVYAGHTHGKREYHACPNLVVRVGNARYGRLPTFQPQIEI